MSQLDPTLLGFILVVFGLSAALLTLLITAEIQPVSTTI